MRRSYYFLLAILMLALISCEDVLQDEATGVLLTEEQIDDNIKSLSLMVANAVDDNAELVKEIETEIGYRFDYDNDALLRTFLGRKISGKKFEDILADASEGEFTAKEVKRMIIESGYLQFTFPQNYKELGYESVNPLAVPIYSFIDEKDTEYLEAFDKDGNVVKLSTKEMPSVPVIVVGCSERVDDDGNMLVSERSVVLPKEMRTLHYTKAIELARDPLKSAKTNNHIVTLLSEEELQKLGDGQESGTDDCSTTSLKSVASSNCQLTGYTIHPKEIKLNWNGYSNATQTANRYKVFREDVMISDQSNSRSFDDDVPESGATYDYYVQYFNGNTFLNESNHLQLHSSFRNSGGHEYIDYLYASHATTVAVEGWWVSELEINWEIYYVDSDGEVVTMKTAGDVFPTSGTKKHVSTHDDRWLFKWNKTSDSYSSYTIRFWEDDDGWRTKTDEAIVDVASLVVAGTVAIAFPEASGVVLKFVEEIGTPVSELVTVLRKDDPLGTTSVQWWLEDEIIHPMDGSGFKVRFKHD